AGEKCERLLDEKIRKVKVNDLQLDEIWAYVGMKEKTKKRKGKDEATLGDAYTFVAFERDSKLILAWHLGRRTERDTLLFTEKICTSHVERQNLNIRMAMRRFTRLTNAFSKKWENLKAALALYFAYYNFCRIHKTIRCTPAMEAGITGHVWELKELLA